MYWIKFTRGICTLETDYFHRERREKRLGEVGTSNSRRYCGGRHTNIDILRIVASFMVIVIHVSASEWYSTDVDSAEWAIMNFYDSAVRSCVPLFFMMSGVLFLDREKMLPISKLLKNNILKLVIVYIAWALLYAIDTIGIKAFLTAPDSWDKIIAMIISSKYHLWFLPTMIGVYLLVPFMFALKEYENGKYISYAVLIFFVFAVFAKTMGVIPFQAAHVAKMLGNIRYELVGFSGYFLLGYFLSKKKCPRIRKSLLLFVLLLVIGVATFIGRTHAISVGEPTGILYGYMMLPVFLEAVLIFIIFFNMKLEVSDKIASFIASVSKCTLGIYLLHPFIIEHLKSWFGITTVSFNVWLSVPIISIIIFVVGMLVTFGLLKIPVVNKWLV